MEEVLDQPLIQTHEPNVRYGGFWPRLGALIIDGLVLAPLSFGLNFLNITTWKSSLLLLVLTLVSIAYKPFMEMAYGATLGKMAFDLKVVNLKFERASLSEVLLRNVFHLAPSLLSLVVTFGIYQLAGFESVSGYGEYTEYLSSFTILEIINFAHGLLFIADTIVLLADRNSRAWHDKIASTCVIQRSQVHTA